MVEPVTTGWARSVLAGLKIAEACAAADPELCVRETNAVTEGEPTAFADSDRTVDSPAVGASTTEPTIAGAVEAAISVSMDVSTIEPLFVGMMTDVDDVPLEVSIARLIDREVKMGNAADFAVVEASGETFDWFGGTDEGLKPTVDAAKVLEVIASKLPAT